MALRICLSKVDSVKTGVRGARGCLGALGLGGSFLASFFALAAACCCFLAFFPGLVFGCFGVAPFFLLFEDFGGGGGGGGGGGVATLLLSAAAAALIVAISSGVLGTMSSMSFCLKRFPYKKP